MELKPYQAQVIDDLARYLECVQETKNTYSAFQQYWTTHPRTPINLFLWGKVEPYKETIPRVPHICIKVPTAGGKTFIACNAIKTFFDAASDHQSKAVVWLVPSVVILEQTIKNLKNPQHPYRQKINVHFGSRVEVLTKEELLQGSRFDASSVRETLTIMVFSYDSLRTKNKDGRKVFQENGNLQSFEDVLGKEGDITLGAVINYLQPMVIVDESHNAQTELSVEMLKNINPRFILELTATPRNTSNIISFVDAMALKRENMVKLPVIVYNQPDKTEVVNASLQLQRRLEILAKEEEEAGGQYIRPIVLFQVQPKNGKDFANVEEEKNNVERLKEKLLELKIPVEQIKIKTANINEIKGLDLLSRDCEVRYIITINALKEGWDCPFAYILATLADKNSAVDVEQVLGRVLRQPYVVKHKNPLLNLCYVYSSSNKFMDTLSNIVVGLNKAGFSEKDYKVAEEHTNNETTNNELDFEDTANQSPSNDSVSDSDRERKNPFEDIDSERINNNTAEHSTTADEALKKVEKLAMAENEAFEKRAEEAENENDSTPQELEKQVNKYKMKDIFRDSAIDLVIPQFFMKVQVNPFMGMEDGDAETLVEKEHLLTHFELGKEDTKIDFDSVDSQLYKIDLDVANSEHTPVFTKLDGRTKDNLLKILTSQVDKSDKVRLMTKEVIEKIGNHYPITEREMNKYIARVLVDLSDEQFQNVANNEYSFISKIKNKIKALSEAYAEKEFKHCLDTGKVYSKPFYKLPPFIIANKTVLGITKTLYEKEGEINDFEKRVINEVANMENVEFWTRNIERKGFYINGFINHYPDFIIKTKKGKVVILETKGDHLDAEQKINLGAFWANKAGESFRYFMVYNNREVAGALQLDVFLNTMRLL